MLQAPKTLIINPAIIESAAKAAQVLGTLLIIRPEDYSDTLLPYARSLAPSLTCENAMGYKSLILNSRVVELAFDTGIEDTIQKIREIKSDIILMVRIPLDSDAASRALNLSALEVDTLHFYGDEHGNEMNSEHPRFLKEMIREIHLKLVNGHGRAHGQSHHLRCRRCHCGSPPAHRFGVQVVLPLPKRSVMPCKNRRHHQSPMGQSEND